MCILHNMLEQPPCVCKPARVVYIVFMYMCVSMWGRILVEPYFSFCAYNWSDAKLAFYYLMLGRPNSYSVTDGRRAAPPRWDVWF